MERQIIMKEKDSFFTSAAATLNKYNLPSISRVALFSKYKWKTMTKAAIEVGRTLD